MAEELYSHPLFSDANLVSYWRFQGNSNDSKGSNNGTDTAITYSEANGKWGQGAGFNGSSSYIQYAAKILPVGAKTVMFWIKTSNTGFMTPLCSNVWDASSNGTAFFMASGNIFFQERKGGEILSVGTSSGIATGELTFVAGTWDGTTTSNAGKIYINGQLINSATATGTQSAQDHNLRLGLNNGGVSTYYFNGSLDDLAIFSRALTDTEISSFYKYSLGGFYYMSV